MSLSPHDLMLESNKSCTVTLTSPPSHHEQNMHCGYSNQITSFSTTPVPHQSHSHSHNNQSSSLLNLLQLSQEKLTDSVTEISAKNDDDYGFLWDMNLEESSFENGTLDDMRFEMENSMVLLWIKKHTCPTLHTYYTHTPFIDLWYKYICGIYLAWLDIIVRRLCLISLYLGSSTLLFFLYTTFVICKNIINLYQFFISVRYLQSSLASWTYLRSNDETCCKSTTVIQRMSGHGPYICMLRLSISLQ